MKKLHRCSICKYGKSPCDWCWTDPDGELNFEPIPDAIETLIEEYEKLQEETAALRAQQEQQDNEPLEYRKYQCLECGHEWLEDCDTSDYPDYCPGCGTCLLPQAEDDSNNTMREREVRSTFGETWFAYRRKPGSVHHHEI